MKENVLGNKKHGMFVLIITLLLYLTAVLGTAAGGFLISRGKSPALLIISISWLCIGWIPFCGLKVLKPQEALVLTLFGKYIGTIKNEGFYAVNPFCSSEIVAARIRDEIQAKVKDAGLEVLEARITYLACAPEIAAVMLQRQQASAIIDARKMIVDGAVGMVEMALERLNENQVVELDEERKAAMVSNLLVVLCGNHDAQPIVNSGSLY